MTTETAAILLRQHEIAWKLASYHLDGLGLAVHPDDGEDAETLLRRADAGMYGMKPLSDA